MKPTQIEVAGEKLEITPGAKRGQELMSLAQIAAPEQLVLEVEGDVDIAVNATDIIVIRGNERFSVGDGVPQLPDNPVLRNPIGATLNELPLGKHGHDRHGKVTTEQLVAWAGGGHQDVWLDLEGLADEMLSPGDRIVIQHKDHFITVPREEHDRTYEVTVLFDGEDKMRRFPVAMTVLQAIRRSLPPRDRVQASEFQMVDGNQGTSPLDVNLTLKAAGVRDGHVLSITKKNGGGG